MPYDKHLRNVTQIAKITIIKSSFPNYDKLHVSPLFSKGMDAAGKLSPKGIHAKEMFNLRLCRNWL